MNTEKWKKLQEMETQDRKKQPWKSTQAAFERLGRENINKVIDVLRPKEDPDDRVYKNEDELIRESGLASYYCLAALDELVWGGVIEREKYSDGSDEFYHLTTYGEKLLPALDDMLSVIRHYRGGDE
jgi:DNA-binding HxlR family transcriptional regulator